MSKLAQTYLLAFFVLPILIGVAVLFFTWAATRETRTRRAVAGAVAGSILLVVAAALHNLCGLAENRSDLFNERCSGATPDLPFLGIPVLFLAAFGASRWNEGLFWALGALGLLAALVVPWKLLDV